MESTKKIYRQQKGLDPILKPREKSYEELRCEYLMMDINYDANKMAAEEYGLIRDYTPDGKVVEVPMTIEEYENWINNVISPLHNEYIKKNQRSYQMAAQSLPGF